MTSILEVDAVSEHRKSSGFEDEFVSPFLDILRPAEGAFFKSLGDYPITGAVEVENFDESATPVGEEEGGSAGGGDFDRVTCQFGESVEGLTHVTGFQGDVDFEVSVEGEHRLVRRGL